MSKKLNRDDIDKFHDYGLYIPTRTIYMGSEQSDIEIGESGVDSLMAERNIKNLHILEALNKEPITIVMNNIGGDFYHGLALFGAIRQCQSHITIKVFGHAMSMGAVILQAADERIMDPYAKQMIHYGEAYASGHAKTVDKISEEGKKLDAWMEQLFLDRIKEKHKNFTLAKIKKMLNHDTFLTAKESVELGLADKILGDDNE